MPDPIATINELNLKVQAFQKAKALHEKDPVQYPDPGERPYSTADLRAAIHLLGADRLEKALAASKPKAKKKTASKKSAKSSVPPLKLNLDAFLADPMGEQNAKEQETKDSIEVRQPTLPNLSFLQKKEK